MTICGMTIYDIAQYFLIYSFLGWTVEVIYQAVGKGIVINRGFLNGPVCPIYGFGVVAVFMLINQVGTGQMEEMQLWEVFLFGVALATLIELIGGFILDKAFHARWWDYRDQPFNLNGYVCLKFSLIWGLGIVMIVRNIHPFIAESSHHLIPERMGWIIMGVLYPIYVVDFIVSVSIMIGLNRELKQLDEMQTQMRRFSDELSTRIGEGALDTAQHIDQARVQRSLAKAEIEENWSLAKAEFEENWSIAKAEFEDKREEMRSNLWRKRHFGSGRLLRAFPRMDHHQYRELLEELKENMKNPMSR